MEFRKATIDDLNDLLENRIEFVTMLRKPEDISSFKVKTEKFIRQNLTNDKMLAFIAIDNKKIVSSCILCIYETLPTPSCLNGKNGLLLNVYTLPEYRRQGLAKKSISLLIEEAKKQKVDKIVLSATDDGYWLYQDLGFKEIDREMMLSL